MSTKKKQFENVEEFFNRLEKLFNSVEKGYNPRDKYELLNECQTLMLYFDEFLKKYYKKIESNYQKRLEVAYKDLSQDTGGIFNTTGDVSNIPPAKNKSYKSDTDISSNQRNILDD